MDLSGANIILSAENSKCFMGKSYFVLRFFSGRRGLVLFVQTPVADERADHKTDACDDEWEAEDLSHVESHAFLEINLFFLDEFDEEAECEDEG